MIFTEAFARSLYNAVSEMAEEMPSLDTYIKRIRENEDTVFPKEFEGADWVNNIIAQSDMDGKVEVRLITEDAWHVTQVPFMGASGMVVIGDNGQITMLVDSHTVKYQFEWTVRHELQHVRQIINGDLSYNEDMDTVWKGVVYPNEGKAIDAGKALLAQLNTPWEREAWAENLKVWGVIPPYKAFREMSSIKDMKEVVSQLESIWIEYLDTPVKHL